jgi:hypothetical protein
MRYIESAISLLGLAITILAWIVPQDRIGYDVKFALLGAGLMAIALGVALLIRGWLLGRGKQQALDQLSEAISQAIHELINKPRPVGSTASWDAFAGTLADEYSQWCLGVEQILANTAYFTRSDAIHFQRLGVFPPVVLTHHLGADHTLAMLTEKIKRLRDIIEWNH